MNSRRKITVVLLVLVVTLTGLLVRRKTIHLDANIDQVRRNGQIHGGDAMVSSTGTLDDFQPRQQFPLKEVKEDDGYRDPRTQPDKERVPGPTSHGTKMDLKSGVKNIVAPLSQYCTPARDIVYIKVHKTGSSTLQNIFYRFGDERNLTFVLPASNFYIEGVGQFKPAGILRAPPGEHYNILANHARFFYDDFKKIMPKDTKFVTLIREAASHFSSMYTYFVLKRQYKVELEQFSLKPRTYFDKYGLNKMGRLSGRDPQLFDLGYNKNDMYNNKKVDEYIQYLDDKMDLVLLTEHFLESLILLKELMCWDLQTIVHLNSKMRVPLNKGKGAKVAEESPEKAEALTKRLNEWNAGDYKLYDHFNRTLWRKVDAYGREKMAAEIELLKELAQRFESECMSGTKIRDISYWSGPIGLKEYVVRKEKAQNMTCKRLGMSEPEFVPYLRQKHKARLQVPTN